MGYEVYQYPQHIRGELDYTAIAFSTLKHVPKTVEQTLKRTRRWEDLRQTVYTAALEAYRRNLTAKQTRTLAFRRVRNELKQHGFVRMSQGDGQRPLLQREFLKTFDGKRTVLKHSEFEALDKSDVHFYIPDVLVDPLFEASEELDLSIDEIVTNALIEYLSGAMRQ